MYAYMYGIKDKYEKRTYHRPNLQHLDRSSTFQIYLDPALEIYVYVPFCVVELRMFVCSRCNEIVFIVVVELSSPQVPNECLCSQEFVCGRSKRELLAVRIRVPLFVKKRFKCGFFRTRGTLLVVVVVNVALVAEAIFHLCLPSSP